MPQTTLLLDRNIGAFFIAVANAVIFNLWRFLKALMLALRAGGASPKSIFKHMAYLAEACLLYRMLAKDPVDHVHAHFGTNPAMVARLLHKLGGPPYSFTVHGPDEFDRPQALDLAGKITDASLTVAISSFGRSQLMRWSDPAHWDRIAIVRCGVDESFLQPIAPQPIPAAPRLCCVARLSAQKGLPLLIEAAALIDRRGLDFHLTLVGDGEMRPEIEQMIAGHGLEAKVHIAGWSSSEAVRDHILNARAMVLPSFAEGLPVVIMEALALSRPVIATAIAGTPELVDEACGWLIRAGSVEHLADAMAEALTLPVAELQRRGAEGRRRVLEQHDSRINGAHLLKLIEASHGINRP
ncbi:glycosyltransferase [Sphingobium boeckii]|uniref:glycosyltransferase n=1 Tax=Sphingobium boeckii TaxID=1082345 RepID=UPI001C84FC23|nr:glycosyltransferase [Sphingobium boeckii]